MADPFKTSVNKVFGKADNKPKVSFSTPERQSQGILDDFAVRKNINTQEGTIEKAPTDDNHIVNKKYVDPYEGDNLGSDLSGVDGATDRVLTLSNTSLTRAPVLVYVGGQLISLSDLTISHLAASSTITFALEMYNTDKIRTILW